MLSVEVMHFFYRIQNNFITIWQKGSYGWIRLSGQINLIVLTTMLYLITTARAIVSVLVRFVLRK